MPATSKAQQRLFGLAYAIKKGDVKKSDADAKAVEIADSMSLEDLKKFAETDHKGLPDKVKESLLTEGKGYTEARKLIDTLRAKTYKKLDDDELWEFKKEMVDHLGGTLDEGITPGSIGGMGSMAFPSNTNGAADGSGDVPAGRGDAEEEYKKKKKKRDAEIKKQKNESMVHTSFDNFINEEYEAVGKYNTVKKVIKELGRRPSEKEVAQFIMKNYKDVTGKELKNSDPETEDKIADIVAFYKFDIGDWEEAMYYAQNESIDEAKDDRSHIMLRVAPRNVNNMRDKLQDMHVNHRVEDFKKGIIKVYTDPTSGWYGNEKAQYKLSHDVWVDKFVVKESVHEAKAKDAREDLGYVAFLEEMSDLNAKDRQRAYQSAVNVLMDKGMSEKEAVGFLNSPHGKYMAEYVIPGMDFGREAFLDKLDEYYNERMLKKYAKDFVKLA